MQVGDVIKVTTRETIPADIILIAAYEPNPIPEGICYIETKSLDGETNLKLRNAVRITVAKIRQENGMYGHDLVVTHCAGLLT